jgi:hypothetical protein
MMATMISAGTPYSASARASADAFARQKATPPSTRSGARSRGEYSYHLGGTISGRSIAATIFGWNFACASQRSTCRCERLVDAATSMANARTSARAE